MCGEMAGEADLALILLGLGLDEFSVPPRIIPELKYLIRSITLSKAKQIAQKALGFFTGKEVEKYLQIELKEILK